MVPSLNRDFASRFCLTSFGHSQFYVLIVLSRLVNNDETRRDETRHQKDKISGQCQLFCHLYIRIKSNAEFGFNILYFVFPAGKIPLLITKDRVFFKVQRSSEVGFIIFCKYKSMRPQKIFFSFPAMFFQTKITLAKNG